MDALLTLSISYFVGIIAFGKFLSICKTFKKYRQNDEPLKNQVEKLEQVYFFGSFSCKYEHCGVKDTKVIALVIRGILRPCKTSTIEFFFRI